MGSWQPGAGLPPHAYTDDDVFRLERAHVFDGQWLPVCRAQDVARPGDYVTRQLFDDPIVVTRTRDGKLAAMANVCRHRNMVMLTGSGNAKAIQCPYHLWTYDLAGALVAAPQTAGLDGFDPGAMCLPHLAVEEWMGFVMVNSDLGAPSLADQVPGITAVLDDLGAAEMVRVASREWHQPWNWKTTFENYAESYHHQGVHRDTLQPYFPAADSRPVPGGDEPWFRLEHGVAVDGVQPLVVTAVYPLLWPSFVGRESMAWLRIEPHDAHRSTLVTEVFVHADLVDDEEFVRFQIEATEAVNAEDELPNRGVQAGLGSRYAVRSSLHPLEAAIAHFHEWYRARMPL